MSRRSFWVFLGYSLTLVLALFAVIVFFMAYVNGYRVMVCINSFGEATPEFFLVVFSLPFIIYGYIQVVRMVFEDEVRGC